MAINVDPQFIQKINLLVREVLSDEAKYIAKNDQNFLTLHNRLFTKVNETPFAGFQPDEKKKFNKYFYINGDGVTPRQDVPFANSPDEQGFFFDQFRNQIKFCTYNYDRMDFLRPSFADEKATEPAFDGNQVELLTRGVIYPVIHSLEQREIASLEKRKAGLPAAGENLLVSNNPYQTLGDKILVQGESGQFDCVLTFAQMAEIAEQEDMLRKQGLDPQTLNKLLHEFIQKRFPGLNIFLDPQGRVVSYMGALGVSATGREQQGVPATQTFSELIGEMKARQGRQLQYNSLIAGKGTLGFSTQTFGSATPLSGLTLTIDQGGLGNNAVYFLTDNQGDTARYIVDTSEDRLTGSPAFGLAVYDQASEDDPAGPRMRLARNDLPLLQTPYRQLYQQLGQPNEYEITGGGTRLIKPATEMSPAKIPAQGLNPEEESEQPPEVRLELNIPVMPKISFRKSYSTEEFQVPSFTPMIPIPRTVRRHDEAKKAARPPRGKVSVQGTGKTPAESGVPANQPGAEGTQEQPVRSQAPVEIPQPPKAATPKRMPKAVAAMLAAGLPIAGLLGAGGFFSIFISK